MTHASAKEYGNAYAYPRTNSFLLVLGISIAAVISVPLWLFDEEIALSLLNEPRTLYVQLGILLLFASIVSGFVTAFLVTGHATGHLPVASISAALVAVLLGYLFIPGNPIFWAILSIVLLHGFEFAIKLGIAFRKNIISIRGFIRFQRDLLMEFSTSLVILIVSSAINAVAFWLLRVMLVRSTDNFTPLALFDVSFQYLAVEMMVLNNVVAIFHSRAASQIDRDPSELRRTYVSALQIIALVTLAAIAVNLVFADFLIGLYGKGYDPQMLRILTFVLPLYAMAVFMNRSFVTTRRTGVLLLVSVLSSVFACLYARLFMTNAYDLAVAFAIYYGVSVVVYFSILMHSRLTEARPT